MDAVSRSSSPVPMGTGVSPQDDPCPICYAYFHGRKVAPVVVKTQCGHRFDLACFSACSAGQPLGSRRCAMCRQNPMPVTEVATGESLPDGFFPDNAFFDACLSGNLLVVREYLSAGANVNAAQENGWTALMSAAQEGKTEVVKLLIENGANVNAAQENGATALISAAQEGKTEVADLLIKSGANVHACLSNAGTDNGWTALMAAAQQGKTEVVKLLINNGAKIDAAKENGWTALMAAAQEGKTEVVKLLINNDAKVNACVSNAGGFNGWTALMSAAQNGHKEIVELLLARGGCAGAKTATGDIALFLAGKGNHWNVVRMLI